MMRRRGDFPQPGGRRRATSSPGATSGSMSLRAKKAPNRCVMAFETKLITAQRPHASASTIGRIGPRSAQERHVVVQRRIGNADLNRHNLEEKWVGQIQPVFAKVFPDVKLDPIIS